MIPLFISFALVLALVSWRVLKWAWLEPKMLEKRLREQGFRGNSYRLLFGDLKEEATLFQEAYSKPLNLSDDIVPRVVPHHLQTSKKYGKRSILWLGPKPSVFIMEPDLIKEVMEKIEVFQKPKLNPLNKLLLQGIVSYDGDKWAKHRKILNPAFHMEKLKLMIPAFYESASAMLRKWEEIAAQKGTIEVDVWPNLQTMTGDVISRTAFGNNYEAGRRIFELQREQAEHLIQARRSGYFPGKRFLPIKRNMRMKQIAREIDDSIREMINVRLKSMQAGERNGEDLLGLLLEENGNHGNMFCMSIQEVIEECKVFYFAGQETTAVLLVWTMVLLSRYQDWQSRAREEVLQIFGTNKPEFEGLNHLKIVSMILLEVLRLYPPVGSISRKIVEETKLGDIILPAGVIVTLPAMLMHHDPKIWGDDAKEFNPERFAEGVSHATKGLQVAFFPFGWGPRICLGQNFAMLEAKLAMAMILQRFSFELSPSYSHAPRSSITLQPQYGAHLILHNL